MANPCIVPQKNQVDLGDNRWYNQHEHQLQLAKESEPELVFIGDSLISFLTQTQIWHNLFEPLHCLAFGIGGDKVEHCLWRVQDGILDSIKPKVIVILVGTNNTEDSAENIADGILELIRLVQTKQPQADVVELLPRGKLINKLWTKNLATNQILADKLSPAPLGPKVHLIQHNTDEIISKDEISQGDFYDYLHLTESGYRKVFTPVYEKVKQILSDLDK
ncbi:hypothetical protein M8J76_001530 [Diaphorina citri]|nr:hypothetical protein M8J76_001530 [Diaphorina citri]